VLNDWARITLPFSSVQRLQKSRESWINSDPRVRAPPCQRWKCSHSLGNKSIIRQIRPHCQAASRTWVGATERIPPPDLYFLKHMAVNTGPGQTISPLLSHGLHEVSIIFYRRGLPLLSGSGMRYTPFRNESARIEPLGQESCQRAYRCATRFGGSPKKPPAFMWWSRHCRTTARRVLQPNLRDFLGDRRVAACPGASPLAASRLYLPKDLPHHAEEEFDVFCR
jgi:hypothetical protein